MDKRTTLSPKIYKEVAVFRQLLAKHGLGVEALYVFGSYARGKENQSSDIDIAVISPDFSNDRQGERVRLMSLSQQIDLAIEPHPFLLTDFNDPYYPLAREVKKTGIKV